MEDPLEGLNTFTLGAMLAWLLSVAVGLVGIVRSFRKKTGRIKSVATTLVVVFAGYLTVAVIIATNEAIEERLASRR